MIPWLMALPSFIWETGPLLWFFSFSILPVFHYGSWYNVCVHVCEHIRVCVYPCARMHGKWMSVFIVSVFFVKLTNITFLYTPVALLELESLLSCLSFLLAVPTASHPPRPLRSGGHPHCCSEDQLYFNYSIKFSFKKFIVLSL